jgi:fused signal recognition particle receptor
MEYVIIAVVAVVAIYFLFFRKSEPAALPPKEAAPEVKQPRSERRPEKTAPKRKAEDEDEDEDAAPTVAKADRAAQAPEAALERPRPVSPAPPPVASPTAPAVQTLPPAARERAVESMRRGLSKSRSEEGFFGRLRALFSGKRTIDESVAAEMEDVLLASDVGVETTQVLLDRVKEGLERGELSDESKLWGALRSEAEALLKVEGQPAGGLVLKEKPTVVLLVGVNGAGKTTTIGKLATQLRGAGKKVVLAAGDTFRAAAVQQLVVWGERVGCEVVRGKDGADPGSVLFEAIKRAIDTGADVVLADTAGRLHTKQNLMSEMKKVAKTAEKALPGAPHELLLVLDATNGQNALAQAREFKETLPLTGIVLTKLDGTAKGGVVLGVSHNLKLPIRFVGLGERAEDLHEFQASEFVEALLGQSA